MAEVVVARRAKRAAAPAKAPSRPFPEAALLALLLALFLAVAAWRQDPGSFGYFHDDTLYLASAYALAAGQGYVMPSVPGAPAQTKYPVLYPLVLAGVWKVSPQFPGNLPLAMWLTALFGCVLIAGWFALLKSLGAGSRDALALTAVSAFHPFTLSLSGAVLSDVPFMAFAVWAAVFAARGSRASWRAAAALAVAAVLTRSIGISVIAGIAAAGFYRRAWRRALLFVTVCAPFIAGGLWWSAGRQAAIDGDPGYRQTMLFYTSYWEFWKLSVPDAPALRALLAGNFMEIIKAPAALCFPLPSFTGNAYLQGALMLLLSGGILACLVRLGRERGWQPAHFILLFYSAVVLLWNYPLANRFLVLFLPLFLLGALEQIRRVAAALRPKRWLAAAFTALVGLLVLSAGYSYLWGLPGQMAFAAAQRRALATEKGEAYQWIKARTGPADRFIAYEDVSLFLHTGRQALRPLALSSEAQYRNPAEAVQRDLEKLTDTARQIQARYWLSSPDDYQLEEGAPAIQQRTELLLRHFPIVFQSSGRSVRIYEVAAQ